MYVIMEESVSSLLYDLLKHSLESLIRQKKEDKIVIDKIKYLKPTVKEFIYTEGDISCNTSYNCMEDEKWNSFDKFNFLKNEIKKNKLYNQCLDIISKKYNLKKDQLDLMLSRFVLENLDASTEYIDNKYIFDQIIIFINDLNKNPTDWDISIWLNGIWLRDKELKINEKIVLRQPIKEDFECGKHELCLCGNSKNEYIIYPSSIMEARIFAKNYEEAAKEAINIVDMMRLYRVGGVKYYKIRYKAKSFLHDSSEKFSDSKYISPYKYSLSLQDIESFKTFMNRIKSAGVFNNSTDVINSEVQLLRMAYDRYKNSLVRPISLENRITSSISCLEALYLKNSERMELSHRLSQRTAALLRLFGFNPLEVYQDIMEAYDIRSTFIHGSLIKKELRKSIKKLCTTVLEYCRVSLLIFIQIMSKVEKEKLINKLDNSLLDEKSLFRLKKLLSEDILIS